MARYLGFKDLSDHFRAQTGFSEGELTAIGMHLIHKSREAAHESDHDIYKVGSAIHIISNGHEAIESGANFIPPFLKSQGFTTHDKIGGEHPTVHGEFPLLYNAPPAKHIFLGCNTPNCANCLKSAIMRGVDALFIDADSLPGHTRPDGTESKWSKDRAALWNGLCLPIARHAQIPIYGVDTYEGKLEVIVPGVPVDKRPRLEPPAARILDGNDISMLANNPDLYLSAARGVRAVIAVAKNKSTGEESFIFAEDCYPPGFSKQEGAVMTEKFKDAKYRFPMDPMIHIMMLASRHNLELENGKVIANFVPSADRQVEIAATGVSHILFSNKHLPISEPAKHAMTALSRAKAIQYEFKQPNEAILRMIEENFKSLSRAPVAET